MKNILYTIILSFLFSSAYAGSCGIDFNHFNPKKSDIEECLSKANNNDAQALFNTAVMLENGKFLSQNNEMALRYYKRASELGHAYAAFSVGMFYYQDKKDYKTAIEWFHLAAERGNVGAQTTLGSIYWTGKYVPQDTRKAISFFSLAEKYCVDTPHAELPFSERGKKTWGCTAKESLDTILD
jgi:FOG: TPR repeat, SEL1 subfamily